MSPFTYLPSNKDCQEPGGGCYFKHSCMAQKSIWGRYPALCDAKEDFLFAVIAGLEGPRSLAERTRTSPRYFDGTYPIWQLAVNAVAILPRTSSRRKSFKSESIRARRYDTGVGRMCMEWWKGARRRSGQSIAPPSRDRRRRLPDLGDTRRI